jgi:hypothetical protein
MLCPARAHSRAHCRELKKSFRVRLVVRRPRPLLIARSPTLPTTSSQVAATISFRQTRGRRRRAPRCTTATSGRRLLLVGSGSPPRHHCPALVCSRDSASLPRVSNRARPRHARRLHTTGTVSSVLLLNSLLVYLFFFMLCSIELILF